MNGQQESEFIRELYGTAEKNISVFFETLSCDTLVDTASYIDCTIAKYEAKGKKESVSIWFFLLFTAAEEQPYPYDLYLELLLQITIQISADNTLFPHECSKPKRLWEQIPLWCMRMASIPPASQ